jgi:hypothetical protein
MKKNELILAITPIGSSTDRYDRSLKLSDDFLSLGSTTSPLDGYGTTLSITSRSFPSRNVWKTPPRLKNVSRKADEPKPLKDRIVGQFASLTRVCVPRPKKVEQK